MTNDARDDKDPNPYGDLPEGYGGIDPRGNEAPLGQPNSSSNPNPTINHSGSSRPDWRAGPIRDEDLESSSPAPPPHWIERQAEERRRRLKELEEQIEAEARGEKWEKPESRGHNDAIGWPPKPAAVPSSPTAQPRVVTGSAWQRAPAQPHVQSQAQTESRLSPPPPPEVPPASDISWMDPAPAPKPSRWPFYRKWLKRLLLAGLAFLILAIAWLSITAPPSQTEKPIAPPRLTLLASDGSVIARNGAIVDAPVKIKDLPPHVKEAFMAIEDRRFYSHWGLDPIGIARAMWNNVKAGSAREGGSTITQQLAKITYLNYERNMGRKARETLIAFWLEAWLTKDEILERYLSNVYFGDNVYGLRAASLHYFNRKPENLTVPQAAMLAGLVKAPSRLAPTKNLKGAQTRSKLVMGAMVDAGYITPAKAAGLKPATLDLSNRQNVPTGTYFADWAIPQIRDMAEEGYGEQKIKTTLDARLQRIARNVVANAGLGKSQVALVAMRPNGEVVAMVGGKSYDNSTFNRATQAKRQPGSTFKLFVYLAALKSGMNPDSLISDRAFTAGDYKPKNYGNSYGGDITLKQAFAKSSNVATVRLYEQVGGGNVIAAARGLGIKSNLVDQPSLALGTSTVNLLELTAAYAGIASNRWPVEPRAVKQDEPGFFESLVDGQSSLKSGTHEDMQALLKVAVDQGTGRAARLAIPAYGKTGTSQDSRDALFVGYAGDLVVGVWVGNDDNSSLKGVSGGGLPARMWRNFMSQAVKGATAAPARKPESKPLELPIPDVPLDIPIDIPVDIPPVQIPDMGPVRRSEVRVDPAGGSVTFGSDVDGIPVDVRISRDGVNVGPGNRGSSTQEPAQKR